MFLLNNTMVEFLLVDGSYYSFYRYFALLNWWKHSHPDEELPDPSQNEDFVKEIIRGKSAAQRGWAFYSCQNIEFLAKFQFG